jgi:predicted phosphodiesterase
VRIGLLADLHWSVAPDAPARWHAPYDFAAQAERCAATLDALVARGCELLVVAGDLTHDGDRASCDAALDCVLSASPVPVAVVEGNHDVTLDPTLVSRRVDVRDAWRRARATADEELLQLRTVGVDRHGRAAGDPGTGPLADGAATVVVSHFPLVPYAARLAAAGLPWPGELADRDARLALLVATQVPTVVLSGHAHVRDTTSHGNVLQVCAPALAERPHEAAVVDVDPVGQAVRCMRIRSGGPAPARGAERWLLAHPDERWTFAGGSWTRREVGAARPHVLTEV